MTRHHDLVDITVEILRETERAVLVSDGDSEVWLPKSQIEIAHLKPPTAEITLPEWLALDKGLI